MGIGYVVENGTTIDGMGPTEDAAIMDYESMTGAAYATSPDNVRVVRATERLMRAVKENGGAISYSVENGTADLDGATPEYNAEAVHYAMQLDHVSRRRELDAIRKWARANTDAYDYADDLLDEANEALIEIEGAS